MQMNEPAGKTQPDRQKKLLGSGCSCFGLSFVGLVVLPLLLYLALVGVGRVLIVCDPLESVDAVVVLSGGEGDRLSLAIKMHQEGFASNLVITDTDRAANARLRSEAIDGGFPRSSVYITDRPVESTYDEALAVRDLALSEGWDTLMVVTDPFHSFRTRIIFRRELLTEGISVLVRPIEGHWFQSSTWFFRAEGWRVVILEIAKLINYLLVLS